MTANREDGRKDSGVRDGDPTENPEFQKVVGYFLRTPPKPHKDEKPKRRPAETRKREKPAK